MGQSPTRVEKRFGKRVAPIAGKYKILSFLGGGQYGKVFKVEDISEPGGHLYALKVIPLQFKKRSLRGEEANVQAIALAEKSLLTKLSGGKAESVVELIDSFEVERSPLFGNCRCLNLVMEYCPGSDLDILLKLAEQTQIRRKNAASGGVSTPTKKGGLRGLFRRRRSSRSRSPSPTGSGTGGTNSDIDFPGYMGIYWFIKLIRSFRDLHTWGVLHRDIKPDNILVVYDTLTDLQQEYRNIGLRLIDFGSGKDISGGEKATEVKGQVYFTAPEVWQMAAGGYDGRADMWSLGMLLLMIFARMSIETTIKSILDLKQVVAESEELSAAFAVKFGKLKNAAEIALLAFFAEHNLYNHLVEKCIADAAVKKVLNTFLLCPVDTRLRAEDLLKTPTVQTWETILFEEANVRMLEKADFDLDAVLTILSSCQGDPLVFSRVLMMLRAVDSFNYVHFIRHKGVENCFKNLGAIPDGPDRMARMQIWMILFAKLLRFVRRKKGGAVFHQKLVRLATREFRRCGLTETWRQVMIEASGKKRDILMYVTFMMALHWHTLYEHYNYLVGVFLLRLNSVNKHFLMYMVEKMIPFVPADDVVPVIQELESNNLLFLRHNTKAVRGVPMRNLLVKRLTDAFAAPDCTYEIYGELLLTLLFSVEDSSLLPVERKVFPLTVQPSRCKAELGLLEPHDAPKVHVQTCLEGERLGTIAVEVNFDNRNEVVPMKTTLPIGKFGCNRILLAGQDEFCVCFFEMTILDGGSTDDLVFGVTDNVRSVLVRAETGEVTVGENSAASASSPLTPSTPAPDELEEEEGEGEEEEEEGETGVAATSTGPKKTVLEKPLYCFTGGHVGCGVTNYGHVFFTLDDEMVEPMISFPITESHGDCELWGVFRIAGNAGMKFEVNFGMQQYFVQFKNTGRQSMGQADLLMAHKMKLHAGGGAATDRAALHELYVAHDPELAALKARYEVETSPRTKAMLHRLLDLVGAGEGEVRLDYLDWLRSFTSKKLTIERMIEVAESGFLLQLGP